MKCRRRDVKLSWTRRFCGTDAIQRLHEEKHWKPELQGHYYKILFLQTLLQQKSRASSNLDVKMVLLQEVFLSPQGAFGWSQHKPTLFTFTYPFITFRFFFFRSNQSLLLRLLEHIQNILLQSCTTGQNECDANMSSTL